MKQSSIASPKFMVLIMLILGCQSKTNTIVFVEKSIIDVGTVKKGDEKEATFSLINTGTYDFQITDIKPDCYCTVPEWVNTPIAPGERTFVKVKVRKEYTGIFQQYVKVEANVKSGWVLLVVRGRVI